jgi:hypothetical protein
MLSRVLVFLVFCIVFPAASPGFAQTDYAALLKRAESNVLAQAANAKGQRFSYSMKISAAGDEPYNVDLQYDPTSVPGQQWTIISPTAEQNSEVYAEARKQLDKDFADNPDAKDDLDILVGEWPWKRSVTPYFLREENGTAIYSFDVTSEFMEEEEGGEGSIAKYLSGELGIDTVSEQLVWMNLFAKKPFKPVVVAKIKKFDIRLQFAPAWQGGPLAQVSEVVDVSGSAMFQKFSEHIETVFSNIEKK